MTRQATIEKALGIAGWMSEGELLWLASKAMECKYIIEYGSLQGRSTRALADNLQDDGKIWAVDPWNGDYYIDYTGDVLNQVDTYVLPIFKENLKDHIATGRVVPCRGFSYNFLPPNLVDMVFIDGDHRPETVLRDIQQALKSLRPGGIISGHDYDHPMWPGVKEMVDSVFWSSEVEIKESIWWTQKF